MTIALITLVGFVVSGYLSRRVVGLVEGLLQRLPFVRLLYTSTRDLLNAFVGEKRRFWIPQTLDPRLMTHDPGDRELVVAEWGEFFDGWLDQPRMPGAAEPGDAIVPSPLMPHLMYQWLVRRARGQWSVFTTRHGLKSDRVTSLLVDRDGRLAGSDVEPSLGGAEASALNVPGRSPSGPFSDSEITPPATSPLDAASISASPVSTAATTRPRPRRCWKATSPTPANSG